MDNDIILVINSGSSTIKFSNYHCKDTLDLIHEGEIEVLNDHQLALVTLFNHLEQSLKSFNLKAVGHRVVHGGRDFFAPVKVTEQVFEQLSQLIPLAPFHQKNNLIAIEMLTNDLLIGHGSRGHRHGCYRSHYFNQSRQP